MAALNSAAALVGPESAPALAGVSAGAGGGTELIAPPGEGGEAMTVAPRLAGSSQIQSKGRRTFTASRSRSPRRHGGSRILAEAR
jgi:hypothetical protein